MGPLEAEAKALEESLLFAWDVGIRDVLFECDSKIVYDAVTGCSDPPSIISNITEGIRCKLQDFWQAQVSHVYRQGNRPIHLLAQYARHIIDYVTWIEETPPIVESDVAHDIAMLSLFNKSYKFLIKKKNIYIYIYVYICI